MPKRPDPDLILSEPIPDEDEVAPEQNDLDDVDEDAGEDDDTEDFPQA